MKPDVLSDLLRTQRFGNCTIVLFYWIKELFVIHKYVTNLTLSSDTHMRPRVVHIMNCIYSLRLFSLSEYNLAGILKHIDTA